VARVSIEDPWLRRFRDVPDARLRLVCLPYAGGAANVFRLWPKGLPDDVEVIAVQYPGRQDRLRDPIVDDMDVLVTQVVAALERLPRRPCALFGHSMGASIAYELTQHLAEKPELLVVSGHKAPHRTTVKPPPETFDELMAEVRRVGGDVEVLGEPELRDLVMPPTLADYRLLRNYLPVVNPTRVPVPIVAYWGEADPSVPEDTMRAWCELTTETFELVTFPGAHFFLESDVDAVLADLSARLGSPMP
jgi:surfactin synthase thioesterase subunit